MRKLNNRRCGRGLVVLVAAAILASCTSCLAASVAADLAPETTLLYERRGAPRGWQRSRSPAPASTPVTFVVALRQPAAGVARLRRWYQSVADPLQAQWASNFAGSAAAVNELTSPPAEERRAVRDWLLEVNEKRNRGSGVHGDDLETPPAVSVESFGDSIVVTTTAGEAARLFNTTMFAFHCHRHRRRRRRRRRHDMFTSEEDFRSTRPLPSRLTTVVRQWGEATVPASLRPFISFVEGLTSFPPPLPSARVLYGARQRGEMAKFARGKTVDSDADDDTDVDADSREREVVAAPATVGRLYYADSDGGVERPRARAKQTQQRRRHSWKSKNATHVSRPVQAVAEVQRTSFSPAQLTHFIDTAVADMRRDIVLNVTVIGPNEVGEHDGEWDYPDLEGSLDVQWMATARVAAAAGGIAQTQTQTQTQQNDATAAPASTIYWAEKGYDWMYGLAHNLAALPNAQLPLVVSISYGWAEAGQCSVDPTTCGGEGIVAAEYVARVNVEFMKLGLRGVSLIAASGDSGANGRANAACKKGAPLTPAFPASSPFVTTVGATQVAADATRRTILPSIEMPSACKHEFACVSGGTEEAVTFKQANFNSGGGFSNVAPRFEFQEAAVARYLSHARERLPTAFFNESGRAYPDVAAIGDHTLIWLSEPDKPGGKKGRLVAAGGTSASAPIFAGVVAQLNELKLAMTNTPLGPLNGFLYQMARDAPQCFTDIVAGDNKCTLAGCQADCQGFECAAGWDPVTGLGTPRFACMANYLKRLVMG
jgi:hypothetical protein